MPGSLFEAFFTGMTGAVVAYGRNHHNIIQLGAKHTEKPKGS